MSYIQCALALCFFTVNAALAGLPKAAWDCDDDKIVAKYYDESCANDEDCFGRSMKCDSGKCACKDDYVPGERFVGENAKQKVCVAAPVVFEECSTTCQQPLVCKMHSELNKKLCHCEPPFKLRDHYCYLECKDNEDYDSKKFLCVPKCKATEVKINETCHSLGQINDACKVDQQCMQGFSECKDGHCVCRAGFVAQDGNCVPEGIRCPDGQVIKSPQTCVFTKDPADKTSWNAPLLDNCPANNFCLTVGNDYQSEGVQGYCCPRFTPSCRVGTPHPTAKCTYSASDNERCPYDSHYCSSVFSGAPEACCPKRCSRAEKFIDGKCLSLAGLNDPCLDDRQCSDSNLACVNGICKCKAPTIEKKEYGYNRCTVECVEGEIMRDNRCHTPLSLGESCLNQTWRCVPNAICNKFNVCSCKCPQFTLSKDVCAPLPTCPAPRRYVPRMMVVQSLEYDAGFKYYAPISEDKRRELLQNITFCLLPGKEPPKIEAVEQCPEGQYCAHYIRNLGLCCKIPDFICPNGKKPTSVGKCSTDNRLSCGLKHFCHNYLYTADRNSSVGKMCCPSEENQDDLIILRNYVLIILRKI